MKSILIKLLLLTLSFAASAFAKNASGTQMENDLLAFLNLSSYEQMPLIPHTTGFGSPNSLGIELREVSFLGTTQSYDDRFPPNTIVPCKISIQISPVGQGSCNLSISGYKESILAVQTIDMNCKTPTGKTQSQTSQIADGLLISQQNYYGRTTVTLKKKQGLVVATAKNQFLLGKKELTCSARVTEN